MEVVVEKEVIIDCHSMDNTKAKRLCLNRQHRLDCFVTFQE